ncbi:MAG: hypothetical protein EAX96_17525 [Candidatus Lokiarchaeota archaeon]|nr:hypothetical protein [Candidatus Lokiarchaeota archaeon]
MTNIGGTLKELFGGKKSKITVIIAIIFFVLGPILGFTLAKIPMQVVTGKVVEGGSLSNVTLAYAFPFNVQYEQSCIIEFTARYNGTPIRLIIVGQGAYNTGVENGLSPDNIAWRNFMVSTFSRAVTPGSSYSIESSVVCTGDDTFYIEFMGDGTITGTDRIWSEPGSYVIIVYVSAGTDAGVFDLKVYLEGPGEIINNIFIIIGLCLILSLLGVVAAILIKRFLEV